MSTGTVRVGVVGTGFGARVVAPAFASIDGVVVVDVVSARDDDAVQRLCTRHDLDLVSIQSPPFLQAWHVQLAANEGHAVLCDKPVGASVHEASDAYETAEEAGIPHFVDLEFRCDPIREHMHALVADGAVGTIEHVAWLHLTSGSRHPRRVYGWLFDAARGGGFIRAWAPHAVDFVRWCAGEVREATAARRLTVAERPDADGEMRECSAEDGFTATLATVGGATVMFDASFAASTSVAPRLVLAGSDGVLVNEGDQRLTLVRGAEREVVATAAPGADRHEEPMRRFAARVVDAVRTEKNPGLPTLADGVAIARVLDKLRSGPLTRTRPR